LRGPCGKGQCDLHKNHAREQVSPGIYVYCEFYMQLNHLS
jgi:hypothetical protein